MTYDRSKSSEFHSKTHIPIYCLEAEGKPVSKKVVNEIERASLTTFRVLGESTAQYQKGARFEDLVDPLARDKQELRTFPRKPNTDQKAMAVVVSTQPVYDNKGREVIALNTENNVQFVNLRRIDDQFSEGSSQVSLEVKAGIAIVEEVVHHIQYTHWGRKRSENTDSMNDIDLHLQDRIEAEAAPLKKEVYRALYPSLDIRVKGVDF